jgi:hypothetical protein
VSRIATDIWQRLESSPPAGENLTARLALPGNTDRLLFAIDAFRQRHILIPLQTGEEGLHDTESRGLTVETKELTINGQDLSRYLDIKCEDSSGHDALDLIGNEIAGLLIQNLHSPSVVVHRVLAKWRRFWGQTPRHMLSREEQIGLFAELWFMGTWLIPKIGVSESIRRWRGPFGARHDFEWVGRSIEVKATMSNRGLLHKIHGIEQLELPDGGDLLFYSLRLREEAGASNTLPGLVSMCRDHIKDDIDAQSDFDAALIQARYSPAHQEEYEKLHLHIMEEGLFSVTNQFPRLTRGTFPAGIPIGIERIDYEINLSGFSDLCIARSESDLKSI